LEGSGEAAAGTFSRIAGEAVEPSRGNELDMT